MRPPTKITIFNLVETFCLDISGNLEGEGLAKWVQFTQYQRRRRVDQGRGI